MRAHLYWIMWLTLLLGGMDLAVRAEVGVTEFMAANRTTLADEDGAFSDWIEIYNNGEVDANLGGWHLTDDPNNRAKWEFPATNLPSQARLIVFASNKDRRQLGAPLHAGFRLDAAGGYLALVDPEGRIITEFGSGGIPYPPQEPDISYGWTTNNPPAVRYFTTPTPGAANGAGISNVRVIPVFSAASGVFTNSITVRLTSPLSGAEIRYTTNGTVPGATSFLYAEPLTFTASRCLRAALIFPGEPPGPSATASYLRLASGAQGFSSPLPIVVLENFGASVIPGVNSRGPYLDGSQVVEVSMQPHTLLIFDRTNGVASFAHPPATVARAGLKLRGSSSFNFAKKSYALETWGETNDDARNVSLLGLPAESDWVLYSPDYSQYDAALIHNSFIYELARQSGYAAPRTRFVEVFINTNGTFLSSLDYAGLFILMEKIKAGKNRVDIDPLATNGMTGGWMINVDRMDSLPPGTPAGALAPRHFHTAGPDGILQTPDDNPRGYKGVRSTSTGGTATDNNGVEPARDDQPNYYHSFFNFESPSGWTINPTQRAAIEDYMRAFDAGLYRPDFAHPTSGYPAFINVDNFVHHFILHSFARNQDMAILSTWLVRDSAGGKLGFGPIWDFDRAYNKSPSNPDPRADPRWGWERLFYHRLFQDADFTQAYIDKWQELRRGAFADSNLMTIVETQTNEITGLVAARHGASNWPANIAAFKKWLMTRAETIDAQFPAPPVISHPGGMVPFGFPVSLSCTQGVIYYTADGSDPRGPGGATSANALSYSQPISLQASATIFARVRLGAAWSGVTRTHYITPQNPSALRLTEIMYHPPAEYFDGNLVSEDELEFIEFKNGGAEALDLSGLHFTRGIEYVFPMGTRLESGAFFLLGRNPTMLQTKYPGLVVSGVYTGKLDNAGESLQLCLADGTVLFDWTFNDRAPWPVAADGHGFSLVPRDAATADQPDLPGHWRASSQPGGSPGRDDPPTSVPEVFINEILSASEPPAGDALELFNPTAMTVDLSGWFLTDDPTVPTKYRIPTSTLIEPVSYLVFEEAQFSSSTSPVDRLAFSSAGEMVYLFSGNTAGQLTGYSHGFQFGGAVPGRTFGRHVISTGAERFPLQAAPSMGTTNTGPEIGPVIITEIHYHPESGAFEYVELQNITQATVPLYDPERPANTWRINGIGFEFPTNITLEAGAHLLITGTNETAFRARYNLNPATIVLGPFAGQLQDKGERLELQRRYTRNTNTYYVDVDVVDYLPDEPWPPAANGQGLSLQRRGMAEYGDDPAHWVAAPPTPGDILVPGGAPTFLLQPQSTVVLRGQSVELSALAFSFDPIQYQWLFNGAPIPGAASAQLTLINFQAADAGDYAVLAYNSAGSVVSTTATLTVVWPPIITAQPIQVTLRGSNSPAIYGQTGATVLFDVTAIGQAPLTYQWNKNNAPLIGETNSTLTLTHVTLANEGLYAVAVSDVIGTTVSSNASLNIIITPKITIPPVSQNIVEGGNVIWSLAITGHPPPFTYEWKRIAGNLTIASNATPAHTDFLTFAQVTTNQADTYRVIIRNAAATNGVSTAFALTVSPDTDGDGLPDPWEIQYFGDAVAGAPNVDSDGDRLTNIEEYWAGTDPLDAASHLRINLVKQDASAATLEFTTSPNLSYSLQFADTLPPVYWQTLADFLARPTNRIENFLDSKTSASRYYRLVTPRLPGFQSPLSQD